MLANDGNFTVFAPSDLAFRRYFGIHSDVERNTGNMTKLLRRHIVVGMYNTQVIGQNQLLMSLDVPQNLRVTWSANKTVVPNIKLYLFKICRKLPLVSDPPGGTPNKRRRGCSSYPLGYKINPSAIP